LVRTARRKVAVVVPLSLRTELTPDESVSLLHLRTYLGAYDSFLIAPRSLNVEWRGFRTIPTADRFFGSGLAHFRLLTRPSFYDEFSAYEYILMYHLDALVFSDQLREWCDAGYDYIGAPLRGADGPVLSLVGNGGFALRRVDAFRRLLRSGRPFISNPLQAWQDRYRNAGLAVRLLRLPAYAVKALGIANNMRYELWLGETSGTVYEDLFIAARARHYDPDFHIAPLTEAFRFAFDEFPRECFERNGRRLPFGCHAWPKYDRAFWEPYLLTGSRSTGTNGA
jgi:hypothetical protein